jgi:hypothetical protein
MAAQEEAGVAPTAAGVGPPTTTACRREEASEAAHEAAKAVPRAVYAGASPGREEESAATPVAAQEVAEASLSAMEAGPPLGRGGEKWMGIVAAQESPTAVGTGLPLDKAGGRGWSSWPLKRRPRWPKRQWMLGQPLDEKRNYWRPQGCPGGGKSGPRGGGTWEAHYENLQERGGLCGRSRGG